jgi:hypothetical protein
MRSSCDGRREKTRPVISGGRYAQDQVEGSLGQRQPLAIFGVTFGRGKGEVLPRHRPMTDAAAIRRDVWDVYMMPSII